MADHLKFDFRVYGVIKSLNPLSIYVAREGKRMFILYLSYKKQVIKKQICSGMARFCTEKYAPPTSSNFENLYSHLTNYSLNKGHGAYVHSTNLQDQVKGEIYLIFFYSSVNH